MSLDAPAVFHATKDSPQGRIYLSPFAVKEYIDRGENIPIDIYLNAQFPTISYRLDNNELMGDVPIKNTDLQKEIYNNGKRYLKKWDMRLAEKKCSKTIKMMLLLCLVVALLTAFGVWSWMRKKGGMTTTSAIMPQLPPTYVEY